MVRVLGVDPGLSRCGIAVVEESPLTRRGVGGRVRATRAGVIRTPAELHTAQRLALLYRELQDVISTCRVDAVAVERVFFNANVRTATAVGQAAGVVLLCAAQAGLPVAEYSPTQVKATVAGTGDADKQQMTYMVRSLLRLQDAPRPADAADALALALCHLQRAAFASATGASTGANGATDQVTGGATAGLPPRLAAAVERSGPGAQIVARGPRRGDVA